MVKTSFAILAAAAVFVGCVSVQKDNSGATKVRKEIERLVAESRYDDARNISVNRNLGGIPQTDEEKMRDNLIVSLVNPEEARFVAKRIKTLRDLVLADLKASKDADARKHIYEFGIIAKSGKSWNPQPTVNGLVFAAKCGLLNSRVNPATYKRLKSSYSKAVKEALEAGDFGKAVGYVAGLKPVPAYPQAVDPLLDRASAEAISQRCEKEGVNALISVMKDTIFNKTAYREGYERTEFAPDWSKIRETLNEVFNALVADDVPIAEAQNMMDSLLSSIKAQFDDDETGENMTTAQLNAAIASLRADLQADVDNALSQAIAKAEAKADAEAKAEVARLSTLRKSLAANSLSAIDPASRAAAFTGAIGSCADSGINRILGDAARIMRLCAADKPVLPADANSLLAASIYMGFADTAKLALSLQADINGFSPKDDLHRTPFLISLQFGTRGKIGPVLAPADRTIRDSNGYGAIHYAVRYADEATLQKLIDSGLDVKSAATDGVTPLMIAADMGNVTFAQALVAMSDADAADAQGRTALHFAAKSGSLPIVRSLVRNGADANAVTKDGDSVLDVAVALPGEAIIAFLLDDAKVNLDERAIDWCVINGKVLPLTTLLAHGGAITDRHLAAAVKRGHYDMVKYLVSLGCDVNADAVHVVFPGPNTDIPKFLIANGYRESDAKGDFVKYQ